MNSILRLEELISYHNHLYWELNEPEISDIQFDDLIKELKELDPNNALLKTIISPLLNNNRKVKHEVPMLSLDKAYTINELILWASKIIRHENEMFSIQPKYDGWAAVYKNKILASRGDGIIGENLNNKIDLINIDNNLKEGPLKDFQEDVLGEIIIKKSVFKSNFQKIIRKDGRSYKTERSALTGLLSSKENIDINYPILTFIDYNKYSYDLAYSDMHVFEWDKFIENVKEWDYPTDGLVIKLKDIQYSHSLGYTNHHPKGQIALKYGNPSGQTKLIDVEWAVGKNNTINPVAILEPVIIAGHTITKANLHNAKRLLDFDLKINDTVIVERCGEIIPDIVKVIPNQNISERKNINITICPFCNYPINYIEPFLYCCNNACEGSLIQKLNYSLDVLGVKNIGKSTIEKLINRNVDDLYKIFTVDYNLLLTLDGFAETSALNLRDELNRVLNSDVSDFQLLASINIKGIGRRMSNKLLQTMTLSDLRTLSINQLMSFPNIGENRATEIYNDLISKSELLDKLIYLFKPKQTFSNILKEIKGKVCFTGKMDKPRKYYAELAEKANYVVVDTITAETTILVCQDMNSSKSKMMKANKLGIQVIQLNDFLKLL